MTKKAKKFDFIRPNSLNQNRFESSRKFDSFTVFFFQIISFLYRLLESMGFGTFQNELNLQSKFEFKSKKKNFKRSNKNNQFIKVEKTEIKSEPMVMFPQLPENWTKKTITGDSLISKKNERKFLNCKILKTIF